MKALVLDGPGRPFVRRDLPDPVAGPGEAVARVLACGAGLTIQHVKAGRIRGSFPRVIGHEIAAEIVEVGPGVRGLAAGDAVTCFFHIFCGHCRYCVSGREPLCDNHGGNVGKDCDGGYAEYVKLPAHLFLRFPPGLDVRARPAEAAVIADALATPYKVLRRARLRSGESVAVFGAGGGLGVHQVMMANWAGCRVIAVERSAEKFEACRQAGADHIVDAGEGEVAEALSDLSGGGVDVAIDYVSTRATLESGIKALRKGGRLVTLGGAGETFRADALLMLHKELELLGSRYVSRRDILETMDLAARGELRPMVSDVRPLEEAEALHAAIEEGTVIGRAAIRIG